jgi:hypothetical protein
MATKLPGANPAATVATIPAVGSGEEMQHGQEQDRDRAGEVQGPGRPGQDGRRVMQVRVEVVAGSFGGPGQQGAGVGQHERIVVGVHDPGRRVEGLGHLVGVVRGR